MGYVVTSLRDFRAQNTCQVANYSGNIPIDDQKAEAPEARHNVAQPVRAGKGGKENLSTVGATPIGYEFIVTKIF